MAGIRFTPNLYRHVGAPDLEVEAATVGEALQRYFEVYPAVRSYLLDNQGAVRHHMVVLHNGRPIADRRGLSDTIAADAQIFVFQALSGG